MNYKIEQIYIGGMYTPRLYLYGWVHNNNYQIIIKSDKGVLATTKGYINRGDVADKFHELKNPNTAFNTYGFYKETDLPKDVKKISIILKTNNQKKVIGQYRASTLKRIANTAQMHIRDLYRQSQNELKKNKYFLHYLRYPQSLIQKDFRKYLREVALNNPPYSPLVLCDPHIYKRWLEKHEKIEKPKKMKHQPKFSFVIPIYNPPKKFLDECIQSILDQTYQNFEICLADDCSPNTEVRDWLQQYAKKDKRIKVVYRKKNGGISEATNSALKLASGEFIALMDNDDTIAPNALYENVKAINEHDNQLDFLYSDEDLINLLGQRCSPHFKPDWSPDTMLSGNYITHFAVLRRSIVDKIDGFITKYNGAQDYDFFLRFIEQTTRERIYHIPKVLYHWRMSPTSTALSIGTKNYAIKAGQNAIRDALRRRHIKARVEARDDATMYSVFYTISKKDKASIIIPTKNNYQQLRKCIRSIKKHTKCQYEIIIVSNNTTNRSALKYLDTLKKQKYTIITINKPFNYSMLNNRAAEIAKGQYLLFMNDDTEVINDGWLEAMIGYAKQSHIGAVGAELIFPNDYLQHCGVVLGVGDRRVAGHAYAGWKYNQFRRKEIPIFEIITPRNYSAVTGACMMITKKKFDECGGFDEKLPVDFNDVDLCLKLRQKGYYNVYVPMAALYHYESLTRGHESYKTLKTNFTARQYMYKKWGEKTFLEDPFYNPNLDLQYPHHLKNQGKKEDILEL